MRPRLASKVLVGDRELCGGAANQKLVVETPEICAIATGAEPVTESVMSGGIASLTGRKSGTCTVRVTAGNVTSITSVELAGCPTATP